MSHYQNTCPTCNDVTQCRCPSPNKTITTEICNKCKSKALKLSEDAAAGSIGAGSIAGVRGSLFVGVKELKKRKKVATIPVITYNVPEVDWNHTTKSINEGRQRSFKSYLAENSHASDLNFDAADIFSKLSQNAKIASDLDGDQLSVFGMEGDDGGITKVYVPTQQAKEFEAALAEVLEDPEQTSQQEIAAILFDLKDRFKIVDVKWPTVEENEEQAAPTASANEEDPFGDTGDAATGDPMVDGDALDDVTGVDGDESSGDTAGSGKELVDQILDMLRADAEARKADAEARTADAHAREADSTAKITSIKLQGEEEIMDAEAHFRKKKEEKKEGERLKMLARYRQENSMDSDSSSVVDMTKQAPSESPKKDEDEERISVTRKTLLNMMSRFKG